MWFDKTASHCASTWGGLAATRRHRLRPWLDLIAARPDQSENAAKSSRKAISSVLHPPNANSEKWASQVLPYNSEGLRNAGINTDIHAIKTLRSPSCRLDAVSVVGVAAQFSQFQ